MKLIPYIVTLALEFYLIPLFVKEAATAMIIMIVVMPLITFTSALIYGMRNGFSFSLTIFAFVLYLPTVFIYYNSSAIYTIIVLLGTALGCIFYMIR